MTGNGSGFALLPFRVSALEGKLAGWSDAQLSLLIVLATHTNESGVAWPSQGRLATLAGISKATVGSAIDSLSKAGWLTVKQGGRGRRYHVSLGDEMDSVAIRQVVVFSGLWAACTPTARKLFVVLLALSRPGDGQEGAHISNWQAAVENGRGEDGIRHVLAENLEPARLARLTGAADRTYREAMVRLLELGLVVEYEDEDNLMILNNPGYHMPNILAALKRSEGPKPSPSAKCAATWRRKRMSKPAESVPRRGAKGNPPADNSASPLASRQPEKLQPADE